ncbi:hypothetical protein GCM10010232_35620 [Streptomyces amakusaensis]|uniref:Amidohydrolase family protein n=1 Tax=Streptomyces amakusaensis TaxID=67271 RepID=A0ABW0AIX3_9ACTN
MLLDGKGRQIHAHAIGDRAVRVALDGYEVALRAGGRHDNRHSISHLQLVHPHGLRRFARLGVVASMQLQWAVRDTWTVDALLPYMGPERHRRLFPARSLERHGALLAGGSDCPMAPLGVWSQIRTAIDREGVDSEGPLRPEREGVARTSALRMHTTGAARQLRADHRTGTLTRGRGRAAVLVLLERDVSRVPVPEISGTEVRLPLVNGVPVYEEGTAAGKAARARTAAATARRPAGTDRHRAEGTPGRDDTASTRAGVLPALRAGRRTLQRGMSTVPQGGRAGAASSVEADRTAAPRGPRAGRAVTERIVGLGIGVRTEIRAGGTPSRPHLSPKATERFP